MKLTDYPRPIDDTGFGIHWSTSATRWGLNDWGRWSSFLDRAPSIKWVKMIDNPGGATSEHFGVKTISLAKRLVDKGIMPVMRIYRKEPNSPKGGEGILNTGDLDQIKRYLDVGCVYFEWNNEPDSQREWSGKMPPNWLNIVVSDFVHDANRLHKISNEIIPVFPAFSFGGGRDNPFVLIRDSGNGHLFDRMALAVHNYSLGRPADYPNDPISLYGDKPENQLTYAQWVAANPKDPMWAWEMSHDQVNLQRIKQAAGNWAVINNRLGGDPNRLIEYDFTCYRAFERFDMWVREAAGFSIPLLCTEGGANIGERAPGDARYPRPTPKIAADLNMEIFHKDPPPYWFFRDCYWAIAHYHMGVFAADYEAQGPLFTDWYNKTFDLNGEIPMAQRLREERSKIYASGPLPSAWPLYKGPYIGDRSFSNELKYLEPMTVLVPVEDDQKLHYRLEEVNYSPRGSGRVYARVKNQDGNLIEGVTIKMVDPAGNEVKAQTKGEVDRWYGDLPVHNFPKEGVKISVVGPDPTMKSDILSGVYQGECRLTFRVHRGEPSMTYNYAAFDQRCFDNFKKGGAPILPNPPQSSLDKGVPKNYGISIQKVGGNPGNVVCYVLGVDHIPCGQNGGRHNCYVQILDNDGQPISGSKRYPGFPSAMGYDRSGKNHFLVLDKPANERKDMVLWAGQVYDLDGWARGEGSQFRFQSSARVKGIASTWADECKDVTWGHHSFYVVLMADVLKDVVEPPTPPKAVIEGPVSAQVDQLVGFSAVNSTGQITQYQWTMGDGAKYTGNRVQHAYTTPGSYKVVLTVTDQNTLISTTQSLITVVEKPIEPPPPDSVDEISEYELAGTLVINNKTGEVNLAVKGKK